MYIKTRESKLSSRDSIGQEFDSYSQFFESGPVCVKYEEQTGNKAASAVIDCHVAPFNMSRESKIALYITKIVIEMIRQISGRKREYEEVVVIKNKLMVISE